MLRSIVFMLWHLFRLYLKIFYFDDLMIIFFTFFLAVNLRLFHREESRPKIFCIHSWIFCVKKLCKIFMLYSIFSSNSLIIIISKELRKKIPQVRWTSTRKKLINSNSFFMRKVYLHMRSLWAKSLQDLIFRSSQNIMNSIHLIKFILSRK